MDTEHLGSVGFFCAYTPLPLLDAAGLAPHRILPVGDWPDEAGSLLHENLCPHVKRVLDRALAGDLPELAGVVAVQSCDAMRRLEDAWRVARPDDRLASLDLPVAADERSVGWMASELRRLAEALGRWSRRPVTAEALAGSMRRYAELARDLERLGTLAGEGRLPGGRAALQEVHNRSVSQPVGVALDEVATLLAEAEATPAPDAPGVPLFVFGNVQPDPAAWSLFEESGARVVADDLCTSGRQVVAAEPATGEDPFLALARGLLTRPPCPRTFPSGRPGEAAEAIAAAAEASGARGAVAHVMKFCDPYLARMPAIRETLRSADLPLLVLEGDCTLRSLGQQRTRLEAFVEMLA